MTFMLKLARDPVPNIKFNVSKAIEHLYPLMNYQNQQKCLEALREMENDERDFDVRYYAEKTLKVIAGNK